MRFGTGVLGGRRGGNGASLLARMGRVGAFAVLALAGSSVLAQGALVTPMDRQDERATPQAPVPGQGIQLVPTPGFGTAGPGVIERIGPTGGTSRALNDAAAARAASAGQADVQRTAQPPSMELTEYQRFVQETTGRSLPLFGYNLFAAGAFPALQNVPVPADYVIGPGDEIDLKIWGAVDADLRLGVDRNGQVTIPGGSSGAA
jgi:hypothetical protein